MSSMFLPQRSEALLNRSQSTPPVDQQEYCTLSGQLKCSTPAGPVWLHLIMAEYCMNTMDTSRVNVSNINNFSISSNQHIV